MKKHFLKFSITHLLMLSLITFVFFSSSVVYAQSKGSINSVQDWHSQANNLPGYTDSEMLTIVLVAVGVVAVGIVTYFIIKSANNNTDSVKSDASRSDTTSQLLRTNVYPMCKSHYSNFDKIKDRLPIQIIAEWRRSNLSFSARRLYLGVKVNF